MKHFFKLFMFLFLSLLLISCGNHGKKTTQIEEIDWHTGVGYFPEGSKGIEDLHSTIPDLFDDMVVCRDEDLLEAFFNDYRSFYSLAKDDEKRGFYPVEWTEGMITDCEILSFRLIGTFFGKEEEKDFCVFYDYRSGGGYLYHEGEWFDTSYWFGSADVGKLTKRPIYLRYLFTDGRIPEGTIGHNAFRYQLWNFDPTKQDIAIFTGFKNKTPIDLDSEETIIELAKNEVDWPRTSEYVYYDSVTGFYLVTVFKLDPRNLSEELTEQIDASTFVIMNDKGITLEIVEDVPTFSLLYELN